MLVVQARSSGLKPNTDSFCLSGMQLEVKRRWLSNEHLKQQKREFGKNSRPTQTAHDNEYERDWTTLNQFADFHYLQIFT